LRLALPFCISVALLDPLTFWRKGFPVCSKHLRGLFAVSLLVAGLAGCGGGADRDALLALVEAGSYEDARARALELRQSGVTEPWLDHAEGLACLRTGEEQLARQRLRDAAAADPSLAAPIAGVWFEAAHEDFEAGFRDRARERMAEAVLLDPSSDPGPMLPAVADFMYRFLKDYDAAFPLYERLYRERPDPVTRHTEWVYRWGHLNEMRRDLDKAREIYEEFIVEWPDDMKQGRFVHWRYMNVLMEQAKALQEGGDLDGAIELLALCRLADWHLDQQERAEFLAGQIREEQGEYALARQHYETILRHAERVESEVVDPARKRLEALDERDAN
jgi:tetratricopeptide (TPR) repeat protein